VCIETTTRYVHRWIEARVTWQNDDAQVFSETCRLDAVLRLQHKSPQSIRHYHLVQYFKYTLAISWERQTNRTSTPTYLQPSTKQNLFIGINVSLQSRRSVDNSSLPVTTPVMAPSYQPPVIIPRYHPNYQTLKPLLQVGLHGHFNVLKNNADNQRQSMYTTSDKTWENEGSSNITTKSLFINFYFYFY